MQAERVEEREDDQVTVALVEPDDLGEHEVRAAHLPVGQHRALRRAGGARGEEDVADVIAAHRRGPLRASRIVDGRGAREEVGKADGVARYGAAEHHDLLERFDTTVVLHRADVVAVEEARHREQHADGRAPHDVARLAALETGVDRYEPRADAVHRERRHHPLADVGCPDRDAIAAVHAACHQRASRDVDPIGELREAPSFVILRERLGVHEATCRVVDELGDRSPRRVGHLVSSRGLDDNVRAWT